MTKSTPSNPEPSKNASEAELASIANLTTTLRADYTALQNDLEQAQEMAADFQRQLAGKSNEVAHFKSVLEKTQEDLARMESHVAELRKERHRLANEVMVATASKELFENLRAERDQFRREAEALRTALTSSGAEYQEQIKLQELEITRLRLALEAARGGPQSAGEVAAGVRDRITELSATVERLETMIRQPARKSSQAEGAASDEFIDISFES